MSVTPSPPSALPAARCAAPKYRLSRQRRLIIFVTDNAVMTLRIKAMYGESEPNLKGFAEIATNLEARVSG